MVMSSSIIADEFKLYGNPMKVGNFEVQARAHMTIFAPSLFSLGDKWE